MKEYVVLIGAIASMVGCIAYIRAMFLGKTKPNRVSWLMWSIAPMIGSAAALSSGVTWSVLPVFMAGFSPMLIFIFSFAIKNAYWKSTPFDYVCGLFSLAAIVGWILTSNPVVAITFSIIADLTAGIPTLKKSWLHPETESPGPYVGGLLNDFTGFVAIRLWNFTSAGFLIYLALYNVFVLSFLYRKKLRMNSLHNV
jgi:hypothetical protein